MHQQNPMSQEIHPDQLAKSLTEFILKEVISDASVTELDPDEDLLDGSLVDSMGVMRLMLHIEETYGYAVPPEDVTVESFMSVNAIVSYLMPNISTGS